VPGSQTWNVRPAFVVYEMFCVSYGAVPQPGEDGGFGGFWAARGGGAVGVGTGAGPSGVAVRVERAMRMPQPITTPATMAPATTATIVERLLLTTSERSADGSEECLGQRGMVVAVVAISTMGRACHAVCAVNGSPETRTCAPTSDFSGMPSLDVR
jgi:hypothetical protein